MAYVDEIMESVLKRNPGEPEFHQAVREILDSIAPVIAKHEAELLANWRLLNQDNATWFKITP